MKSIQSYIMSLREKRLELLKTHEAAIVKTHDAEVEQFFIKVPFNYNKTAVIAMFPQEIKRDFYVEFVNKEGTPSKERQLYKWNYNSHLEEYELLKDDKTADRYLIPTSELKKVSSFVEEDSLIDVDDEDLEFSFGAEEIPIKGTVQTNLFTSTKAEETEDILFSQATIRDVYAILHNKPVSKKEWINNLIKSNG